MALSWWPVYQPVSPPAARIPASAAAVDTPTRTEGSARHTFGLLSHILGYVTLASLTLAPWPTVGPAFDNQLAAFSGSQAQPGSLGAACTLSDPFGIEPSGADRACTWADPSGLDPSRDQSPAADNGIQRTAPATDTASDAHTGPSSISETAATSPPPPAATAANAGGAGAAAWDPSDSSVETALSPDPAQHPATSSGYDGPGIMTFVPSFVPPPISPATIVSQYTPFLGNGGQGAFGGGGPAAGPNEGPSGAPDAPTLSLPSSAWPGSPASPSTVTQPRNGNGPQRPIPEPSALLILAAAILGLTLIQPVNRYAPIRARLPGR